jgi:hypothetical protein
VVVLRQAPPWLGDPCGVGRRTRMDYIYINAASCPWEALEGALPEPVSTASATAQTHLVFEQEARATDPAWVSAYFASNFKNPIGIIGICGAPRTLSYAMLPPVQA